MSMQYGSELVEVGRGWLDGLSSRRLGAALLVATCALTACAHGGGAVHMSSPATASASSPNVHSGTEPPGTVLFKDNFDYRDGIISNEFVHWNPGQDCPAVSPEGSKIWEVSSGTLFAEGHKAYTGDKPTTEPENFDMPCDSTVHNNSNVLRAVVKRSFEGDIDISLDYTPMEHTGTSRPGELDSQHSYDGITLWPVYESPTKFYAVSIRYDKVTIKKKVPEDVAKNRHLACDEVSAGGCYSDTELGPDAITEQPGLMDSGKSHHLLTTVRHLEGRTVIRTFVDDKPVATAVDDGKYDDPYLSGRAGLRIDHQKILIDNFAVQTA